MNNLTREVDERKKNLEDRENDVASREKNMETRRKNYKSKPRSCNLMRPSSKRRAGVSRT
ncbi:hypothetical protein PF003_g19773 [Phytophthora fragariae]|nr:hypothetical protein PF003_g19773 [Phytophthora fragariae]